MRFLFRCTFLSYLIISLVILSAAPVAAQNFPGGFTEQPATAGTRQNLSSSQIKNMLPARGKFTFPQPYATEGVRLTNATDCQGSDCVNYIGYSYWRNINNHVGQDTMLIFLGLDRNKGGAGPSLITYNKITDEVISLGPLFQKSDSRSWATGEGWYFSANMPYELYFTSHSKLQRYDVVTKQTSTVFDMAQLMGSGYYIWQVHSSNDDRVHSATVRANSNYEMLGCMVYFEDSGKHKYYPRKGGFDECQIDKSGDWLLIKENVDNKNGEDNRIINLQTGQERILLDSDGAAGHSDMGYGYMVASDNWAANANSQKLWDFNANVLEGTSVYHNYNWYVSAPAHVSHANSRADIAPEEQYACGSSVNRGSSAHANEIICFTLDGSNNTLVVAPVMTNLDAAGGGDSYSKSPKGNLDPTGRYFIWTSNMGGSRLDAFLVKVPSHLISTAAGEDDGGDNPPTSPVPSAPPAPSTPPTPPAPPAPPTSPAPPTPEEGTADGVVWTNPVNAIANGNTLTKTAGCDGCDDAGATSKQEISSGNGHLEFTVNERTKLRYVGLSAKQSGTGARQIDFALRIQAGYAEVRENGSYKSDTTLGKGDVLRIAVKDGLVSYSRNGQVFYSSSVAPAYPLRIYASLLSIDSTISNAQFGVDASEDTGGGRPPGTKPIFRGRFK